MVDNRSAGFFGIGGSFNFKGGDISGTAAKSQDDKMDGNEYFAQGEGEEEENDASKYVDRSAQLRATLNSLAMMNVANVLNTQKEEKKLKEKKKKSFLDDDNDEEFLDDLNSDIKNEDEDLF